MATIQRYVYGEHPEKAILTVMAVGVTSMLVLVPIGWFELDAAGTAGRTAYVTAFGVLPGLAGAISGSYRLGFPAAAGSGVAPGVAFYLSVAIGTALEVGSFGGGDSPLGSVALVLTVPSFVLATVSFVLGVAVAVSRENVG